MILTNIARLKEDFLQLTNVLVIQTLHDGNLAGPFRRLRGGIKPRTIRRMVSANFVGLDHLYSIKLSILLAHRLHDCGEGTLA